MCFSSPTLTSIGYVSRLTTDLSSWSTESKISFPWSSCNASTGTSSHWATNTDLLNVSIAQFVDVHDPLTGYVSPMQIWFDAYACSCICNANVSPLVLDIYCYNGISLDSACTTQQLLWAHCPQEIDCCAILGCHIWLYMQPSSQSSSIDWWSTCTSLNLIL